jgi:hypothetical protein
MVRFLLIWAFQGDNSGNIQSLIFAAIMSVAALLSVALGVLSDLQRTNRVLLEDQLERIKQIQYGDRAVRAQLLPDERVSQEPVGRG